MTDIITTVVSFILDIVRDVVSNKLSEIGLSDEKFRKVIAREINEINKKLDALARKDLLSSVQFLKEGLNRLLMAIEKKSMNSDVPTTSRNVELRGSTSQRRVNEAFTIINVLANKFKVVSLERLKNAKKSFEDARKEATRAFANEALSFDDRIMATELRIVSRILESFLDDPDAGCSDCLLYLTELHSLPAVRKMNSVRAVDKEFRFILIFKKEKRREKLETIRSINTAVLYFIAGSTTKIFRDGVNWPTIPLSNNEESTFYSKKNIAEINAELNEHRRMEARWPDIENGTTSHKQPVGWRYVGSLIRHEFYQLSYFNSISETVILCSAKDASHCVYRLMQNLPYGHGLSIFVFDSNGKGLKNIRTDLPCGSGITRGVFAMRVLQDKIAVLHDRIDCRRIHFIDISTGKTYRTISPLPPQPQRKVFYSQDNFEPCINILNDSEIMVTRSDDKAVEIYTNEGQLKQTIHLPLEEAFTLCDIAYRAASEEVLVLTSVSQDSESLEEKSYEQLSPKELLGYRLLVYSTNGALKDTYYLCRYSLQDEPRFINCSEGRVALVREAFFQICL